MKTLLIFIIFTSKALGFSGYDLNIDMAPIELKYMLTSLNSYNEDNSANESKSLDQKIKKLNSLLIPLSKAEIYFLIKTEIYKAIYEISPGDSFVSTSINFNFSFLENKFIQNKERYPFVYFLIYGLYNDYKKLWEEKSSKSKLATPWLNFLNENDFPDSRDRIKSLIEEIIDRLVIKISFYNLENENLEKSEDIIKIVDRKTPNESSSVSTIAEGVIKKLNKNENLEILNKKDQSIFSFSDLPLSEIFPEPDPNYNAPEKLPEPTDDWNN